MGAGGASALPVSEPPAQAVALSPDGGLWFDDTAVRRISASGRGGLVQTLPGSFAIEPYEVSASSRGIVLSSARGLMSGPSGGPLSSVPSTRVGCWTVGDASSQTFVIAVGDEVVSDAVCSCAGRPSRGPQPVFVRRVTGGGRWRVLTRVPGSAPPVLAGSDQEIAVGVQRSRRKLQVRFLSLAGEPIRPGVSLPDGYLQFSGPNRLVLTVPAASGFPLRPVIDVGNPNVADDRTAAAFSTAVYTATGTRVRGVGLSATLPLVSDGYMVASAKNSDGTETLFLRSLTSTRSRPLIGFRTPQRTLITAGFLWPRLALVETSDSSTDPCYSVAGPPALTMIDVSRPGSFLPAPASPPSLTPGQLHALCGPPPP
jgi:hypothetical protein